MIGPVVCICGQILDSGPCDPQLVAVLRDAHETVSPRCARAFDRLLGDVLGARHVPRSEEYR